MSCHKPREEYVVHLGERNTMSEEAEGSQKMKTKNSCRLLSALLRAELIQ